MGFGIRLQGTVFVRLRGNIVLRGWDGVLGTMCKQWSARPPYSEPPRYAFMLAGTAFTPDSLSAPNVVVEDRPYSFLFGWTAQRLSVADDGRGAWTSEVTVGLLGTSIGGDAQKAIHAGLRHLRNRDEPVEPKGWHHQIAKGGQPTARVSLARSWLVVPPPPRHAKRTFDATLRCGANLGYYTDVLLDARCRIGRIDTEFWEFDAIPLGGSSKDPNETRARFEWFGFGGLRLQPILYNALLQGQFGHNDHELAPSEVTRVVAEGEAGVSVEMRHGAAEKHAWRLTWTIVAFRTRQTSTDLAASHAWGGAQLYYIP